MIIKLTEGREDRSAPHEFTKDTGDENETSHLGSKFVLEGVQHGDVLPFTELLREENASKEETHRVTEGGLTPDKTLGENLFRSGVDIPTADPGGCKIRQK